MTQFIPHYSSIITLGKIFNFQLLCYQVQKSSVAMPVHDAGMETTVSAENSTGAESEIGTVRTIEATQLTPKFLIMALLVLLVSALTFYVYRQESSDA